MLPAVGKTPILKSLRQSPIASHLKQFIIIFNDKNLLMSGKVLYGATGSAVSASLFFQLRRFLSFFKAFRRHGLTRRLYQRSLIFSFSVIDGLI
jgi:hypothetical protein